MMMTNEKVLDIFVDYLEKDQALDVVSTRRGYAVMLWDFKGQDWSAYHLFCEKRNHPPGDRVSVKPLWTSHAGGSGAGRGAGCKLRSAGFHTVPVNAAVSFHMEAGRVSFFALICESPCKIPLFSHGY